MRARGLKTMRLPVAAFARRENSLSSAKAPRWKPWLLLKPPQALNASLRKALVGAPGVPPLPGVFPAGPARATDEPVELLRQPTHRLVVPEGEGSARKPDDRVRAAGAHYLDGPIGEGDGGLVHEGGGLPPRGPDAGG